jgi:NADPH:quinone reductase-like Zn-dependent oxidoreductase
MGSNAEFEAIVSELQDGRLKPVVDREFALEEATKAYEYLASGAQFGKVVVRISDA